MKILLLLLALIIVAFSGCVEEEPSPEELNAMVIESVDEVETANFATDADQTVKLVNHSETNETLRTMNFETRRVSEGVLNITARTMKMTVTTTSSSEGEDVVSEMEMYIQNDTMYTNIDGNWTRMPGMPKEMWDQQNQVRIQAEQLNSSEIELVGSEKVEGEAAYKVRVVPDEETFTKILSQQMGSMPLMNITEIFEESEMEFTTWISKESHLPLKNQVAFKMTLTSEMMGLPVDEMGEIEMEIRSDSTVIYSGYNEPVVIVVPEEALAAPSWLDMLMAMMSQQSDAAPAE